MLDEGAIDDSMASLARVPLESQIMSQYDCTLVVILRRDLPQDIGTVTVQACHAALGTLEDVTPAEMGAWQANHYAKMVLAVDSEGELRRLDAVARDVGISAYLVHDPVTRVATALGIGPSADTECIVASLPVWTEIVTGAAQSRVH